MPIKKDIVVAAYRDFLQREPESLDVINLHAETATSPTELIKSIVSSEEFKRSVYLAQVHKDYEQPIAAIDVEVSKPVMTQLMERVQREWRKLGENDPYWSVLSNEAFRNNKMSEQVRKQFLATGLESADLIERFEARSQVNPQRGICFELGCGVGRVTYYLSKKFKTVIAADISPGNIELCKQNLESLGVKNVEYLLISDLSAYEAIPPFDFLYSIIVLQHNTPPVQRFIIDRLATKIRPGGRCLFQTAAWLPDYSFSVMRYLASPEEVFELHAIPMPIVLRVLQARGIHLLEVSPDPLTGLAGSFTYFGEKT